MHIFKKMDKTKIKDYLFIGLGSILTIFLVLVSLNYIIFSYGDKIKDVNEAYILQNHVSSNNLSLIFPFDDSFYSIDYINEYNKNVLDLSFEDFYTELKVFYRYEEELYDCKYWSYVWLNYVLHNKERYNWEYDIITTQNHVFILVSNSSSYCVLDQDIKTCVDYE